MNNERFPHPNGHPHDDDLQPERWADAPSSAADALDALLNEIAQGNGSPNPRSGHGHQRPDVRTDTGGADALHAATRAFHRRVEAAQHRDPGSAALDPHLWEQIMTSTTQQARNAQGGLWRDATRNTLSPGIPGHSRNHAPPRRPAQRWAPVANATLALLILLAGFGIWRVYDGLNGSGPADPEPVTPGIAMQPATPEATEIPAVEAPPAAAPAPISACDFSRDIPIFPGVDQSPVDGTALLVTTDGELVLTCLEEPIGVVLAYRVHQASPMHWPGTVFTLSGGGDPVEQTPSVVNIMTGESIEIGIQPESMQYQLQYDTATPWLVAPAEENPSDWAITDLRTMESRLLSAYAASSIPPGMGVMTSANADGMIAIGPQTRNGVEGNGALLEGVDLPGSVLVLDGSLDAPRWIGLPDDLPPYREMSLAPDGKHLALRSTEREFEPESDTYYSVIGTDDGGEVARSDVFSTLDPTLGMQWVQDGEALVYIQNTSLMVLSTEGSGEPVALLEGTDGLGQLRPTYDPAVVTVRSSTAEEVATETPDAVDHHISSVNTVTGEVIEIDGFDASDNVGWYLPPSRFMVMHDALTAEPDTATYNVIDPVSGEVIGQIADVPQPMLAGHPGLGRRATAASENGGVEVIGFGSVELYLMHVVDDEPVVRQLASPPGLPAEVNGAVDLFLSPDGSMLSLTMEGDESRTRWLLPLDGEEDDWIEVPSTVPGEGPAYIFFVPGTGD
ncbi:MAG: hypothetical protein M3457_00790 [Chloroflexota bacterium]|nr:hypothetical protein [Chloroflexota bacterium]